MKLFPLAWAVGLVAALAFSSGCRKKKSVSTPEPVVAQEPSAPRDVPAASAPPPPPDFTASAPVTAVTVEASTEFDDLTKSFQLYCNFKKRVPTDINEFFRDQKIRPPAIPPGTRLAIDPVGKRIILVK